MSCIYLLRNEDLCNLQRMTAPTQLDRIESKVDRLEQRVNQVAQLALSILTGDQIMGSKLEDLQTAVTAETTVVNSAIVLLNGIQARIDAAIAAARAGDNTALDNLSAEVGQDTAALAAAVAANTVAAPPAP